MLNIIEQWIRWAGAVMAFVSLIVVLMGIVRGLRRPQGQATGMGSKVLRPPAYLLIGVLFVGTCYLLWRPLPLALAPSARAVAVVIGAPLYFPGLALVLWGRLTLGEMYNVSSSVGVQLYADHRLITHGPFAIVRHPIYAGLILVSGGGLFIYRTWTLLFTLVAFLGLTLRARREEQALAAQFGEEWAAYCQQVPDWVPRVPRRH